MNHVKPGRVIVGITGASGATIGIRLLQALARLEVETHLVISRWANITITQETDYSLHDVRSLASAVYEHRDQAAKISSGSFRADAMVIAPCSMRTLTGIATGNVDGLIGRAADVSLKEGRPLVLVPRETPMSAIHLRNMLTLSELGVRIVPPMPSFYTRPRSVDELVDYFVIRLLDQLGFHIDHDDRWTGLTSTSVTGERD